MAARAVDVSLDENISRVEIRLDVRTYGTKRIEALGAGELHVTDLKITRGDVVEARVSQDKRECVVGVQQMRTAAADDQGEFAFVLHALGVFRQNDRLIGANNRSGGFQEDQGFLGDFVAELGSMRGIIAADTHNFGRFDRSEQSDISQVRRTRAPCPLSPRQAGNFNDVLTLDETIAR